MKQAGMKMDSKCCFEPSVNFHRAPMRYEAGRASNSAGFNLCGSEDSNFQTLILSSNRSQGSIRKVRTEWIDEGEKESEWKR